jgi:hypothetical protein
MNAMLSPSETERYARSVKLSRAVHWEIEESVIRGRRFDMSQKYMPDGLALAGEFKTLSSDEKRFISQIQGRTYANIFGLVERYITAKMLEISNDYTLGNQVALEAIVRFTDEELKHQALFRRIEEMIAETMPAGYRFDIDPDGVARSVLEKSTWAVLMLTLHIELFTQLHYKESIAPDDALSPLFKDVFLFHWKEESQHAVLDELELRRHDAEISPESRDRAVDEFIALVGAVDGILKHQAGADAAYFAKTCGRSVGMDEAAELERTILKAYRWQYIFSGGGHPRFQSVLTELVSDAQMKRIEQALAGLAAA